MTSGHVREPLTRSAEDYLKAIYHLTSGRGTGSVAATTDLAQTLDLSPASVSGMLRRLAEQGYVEHEPYRGVQLTGEGRRVALRMLRRHRLLEAYLVAHLGYTWDTVHEEAERLEHAVSDELVERMATALGDPAVDPHGDPIPAADGSLTELATTPLCEFGTGMHAEVRRVATSDAERLRYLSAVGLTPGAHVTVLGCQPFNGPITLRLGAHDQVVGHELAALVLCTPLPH